MSKNSVDVEVEEFEKKEGVAATFEEDSNGDRALLQLCKFRWFRIYLIISLALAFSEPFLVAFPDHTLATQKVILAFSTALFLFGYVATMIFMPPELSLYGRFRDAFLPEVWIEVVSFGLGWGLLYHEPGMASLRCFRVFRFVWYTEFFRAEKGRPSYIITFFCHIVLQYLEKIGQELFTTSSKGAVVVLGFFFYMAYVMAVAFWQTTANWALVSPEGGPNGTLSECDTLPHCFLIMLRLTFFDGSGFDFVKSLIDYPNGGLVTLLILYMCVSAMVLLNGLIGIFGGAFADATVDDEKEVAEKEEKDRNKEVSGALERIEQLCLKLDADVANLKHNVH